MDLAAYGTTLINTILNLLTVVGAGMLAIPLVYNLIYVGLFGRNSRRRSEGLTGAGWAIVAGGLIVIGRVLYEAGKTTFSTLG